MFVCSLIFQHAKSAHRAVFLSVASPVLLEFFSTFSQTAGFSRNNIERDMCVLIVSSTNYSGDRGSTVVKMLCYKSEGRWFDPSWCHWNFSLT